MKSEKEINEMLIHVQGYIKGQNESYAPADEKITEYKIVEKVIKEILETQE